LNFHIPALSSTSATSLFAFPEHEFSAQIDPELLRYDPLLGTEIRRTQSPCSDEAPNLGSQHFLYHTAGNDLSSQNAATYMVSDPPIMDQDIGYVPPNSTLLGQHPQPYPTFSMNNSLIKRLTPEAAGSALPDATVTRPQEAQQPTPDRASRVKKRNQDEITDASDVTSLRPSKRKRRPFANNTQKEQTAQVREIGSCIRCAMQHNQVKINPIQSKQTLTIYQCPINPNDPEGICVKCQDLSKTICKLPCLRLKIIDSILFRKIVDPNSGRPNFSIHFNDGVLKPVREWNAREIRTIHLIQGFQSKISFRVCSFEAAALNLADITESRRFIYECKWALADFQEAVDEVGNFLSRSIVQAVCSKVSKDDQLARGIFEMAFRMAHRKEGREV
jgi:hypothetical protein